MSAEVLDELNRTRWARLQRTQFVYWPLRGAQPKIESTSGAQTYLRETEAIFRLPSAPGLIEVLKDRERQLFDTVDDAVVYWRGWETYVHPSDGIFFRASYCMAHLWGDDVHTEARPTGLHQIRVDPRALYRAKD